MHDTFRPPVDLGRRILLGAAADALPQLVAIVDATGRMAAVNAAWRDRAAALGIVPEGIGEGDHYLEACATATQGSSARQLAAAVRAALRGGTREFVSEQHFGTDASEGWLLCRVKSFAEGGKACAVVSLQDISERKRAEVELSRRSKLLAEAEHIAQLGSWEWDIRTGLLTWSDEHYRMFGLEPGRFAPTFDLLMEQLSSAEAQRFRRVMAEVIARKSDHVLEYHAVHEVTGVEHTFVSQGRVVLDAEGEVVRMVGTVQDITVRKAMEEALRESELLMRDLLDERQKLARDLHDGIIQMLYAIGMMLEDAGRLIASAPEHAGERIARAVQDLNGVIRDVRRHIIGVESAPMTGQQLRAELATLVRAMDVSPALRFSLDIEPAAACLLTADEANQLLYIAREAMSNSLRHANARLGSVTLSRHRGRVRLEVVDDGAGFEADTGRSAGGGLHNMRTRARELGAQLRIESSPQQGTRVILDIPKETADGRN